VVDRRRHRRLGLRYLRRMLPGLEWEGRRCGLVCWAAMRTLGMIQSSLTSQMSRATASAQYHRRKERRAYLARNLYTASILCFLLNATDTARVDHPEFDRTTGWTSVEEQHSSFRWWRSCRSGWCFLLWRFLKFEIRDIRRLSRLFRLLDLLLSFLGICRWCDTSYSACTCLECVSRREAGICR
jgi:hypothetical protein